MIPDPKTGKIQLLPEAVSSRIAAGEVVERPASVVKELLDNSLDAGSRFISIEVEDGGKRLIRVTDDGEGMNRIDAELACQRFATSKLRSEEDLWTIRTMGFRGEALPSIASVSRFRLLTACRDETVGTSIQIDGSGPMVIEKRAVAPGTHVEVGELFFNTPGRQKFSKSASTELSHICHVIHQAALSRPATHFRLTHRGRAILDFPSVPVKADRLLQLYGEHFLETALPIGVTRPGLSIEGMTVSPHYTRTSRVPQDILVNSRPVKNATILHAIYEAYGSFLPKGRHPVFVVFLDIDPATVDVNVHPSKREVKFSRPEFIHSLVKESIRRPLQEQGISGPPGTMPFSDAKDFVSNDQESEGPQQLIQEPRGSMSEFRHPADTPMINGPGLASGTLGRHNQEIVKEPAQQYVLGEKFEVRVFGQLHHTFMVAQVGPQLLVVDQHTAHERVLYERLWRDQGNRGVQSQPLLIPEPIDLPPHAAMVLREYVEVLSRLGLEIEPFGQASFLIRSVPSLLGSRDYASLIFDLVEDFSEWKSLDSLEKRVRPVLASVACQGAVQAGRAMEEPEMKHLIQDWVTEGCPMTCPHGRRIAMRFSIDELNRIFGRT